MPVAQQPPAQRAKTYTRAYERIACELPSSCSPPSAYGRKEARWKAVIHDISQGGMRLTLERRYEAGAGLAIEIPALNGNDPYTVLARVVHVQPRDGAWSLGCQLISPLSDEELNSLIQANEHRAQQPTTIARVRVQIEDAAGKIIETRLHNLRLATAWPLRRRAKLLLRGARQGWVKKVEVLECISKNGNLTLRCRFLS